jgi:hypothetical protein
VDRRRDDLDFEIRGGRDRARLCSVKRAAERRLDHARQRPDPEFHPHYAGRVGPHGFLDDEVDQVTRDGQLMHDSPADRLDH